MKAEDGVLTGEVFTALNYDRNIDRQEKIKSLSELSVLPITQRHKVLLTRSRTILTRSINLSSQGQAIGR